MLNLEFQELADENLDFIFSYIADDNYQMAVKVIEKINNTIQLLKRFPYLWKQNFWSIREIVESKYKFRILYKIKWNTVYIISIFKNKNIF